MAAVNLIQDSAVEIAGAEQEHPQPDQQEGADQQQDRLVQSDFSHVRRPTLSGAFLLPP